MNGIKSSKGSPCWMAPEAPRRGSAPIIHPNLLLSLRRSAHGMVSSVQPWLLFTKLELSLLLILLLESVSSFAKVPPTCKRIECPRCDVIHVGEDYEIRRYNSTVWASPYPFQDISLVEATRSGF